MWSFQFRVIRGVFQSITKYPTCLHVGNAYVSLTIITVLQTKNNFVHKIPQDKMKYLGTRENRRVDDKAFLSSTNPTQFHPPTFHTVP